MRTDGNYHMNIRAEYNFFKGHPSNDLLPRQAILEASQQLLAPEEREYDKDPQNRHPLTYGTDEGAIWVRESIANYLNDNIFGYGINSPRRVMPEHLNLNSGASYGVLSILLHTTLAQNGYTRQAFIITPTYFLINNCFIDAGFANKMTAIEEKGADSIDLLTLENTLERLESEAKNDSEDDLKCIQNPSINLTKKIYRYVLYLVPTFANPSGSTYGIETRKQLIEIARKYDMLIIADDVYDMLSYKESKTVMPRMVHMDRETLRNAANDYGNVISNATFSKIIAPGLRFGYHETPTSRLALQLARGGANASGGTPSQLNSMIVGTMILNGSASRILEHLREIYGHRAHVLRRSIIKWLPNKTICSTIEGGYFAWIRLPYGYDANVLADMFKEKHQGIAAKGSEFEVVGDEKGWINHCVRLSISYLEANKIEEGIKLWGQLIKEYADHKGLKW